MEAVQQGAETVDTAGEQAMTRGRQAIVPAAGKQRSVDGLTEECYSLSGWAALQGRKVRRR